MAALFVKLDASYHQDPKVLDLADERAELLYVRALTYAKVHLTDGVIHRKAIGAFAPFADQVPPAVLAAELVRVGLWSEHPHGWQIVAWLDHNPARAEILTPEKGKAMAHKRHHVDKGVINPDCDLCSKEPQVNADDASTDAAGIDTQCPTAMPETETETETETTPLSDSQGSSGSEPVVPSQPDVRRAVRLVAEAVTADMGAVVANPTAYAAALRRSIDTDPDAMARITTALAAGSSPEDIAGSWLDNGKGAAGAERVGSVGDDVRRPVDVARPSLPEVRATDEPRPPAAVAAAGIALARGVVSGSTPVSAGDHRNTSSRPGGGATAPNPTTLAVVR